MSDKGLQAVLPQMDRTQLDKVLTALEGVSKKKPDPAQVRELQKALDTVPGLWQALGDVNMVVQGKLIGNLATQQQVTMAIATGAKATREALGYEDAPPLERLLIEHTITCWLRWQDVEWRYQTSVCEGEGVTLTKADWWERRLSATQRRYLRACETLARVRRLVRPVVQMNIAAEGGQQVNVAGDLEVKRGDGGQPCPPAPADVNQAEPVKVPKERQGDRVFYPQHEEPPYFPEG